MKTSSKFQFKNLTLSIETSEETVTCSLPASKVSGIMDQIQENLRQSFIELDDENREILSQIKTLVHYEAKNNNSTVLEMKMI